MRLTSWVTAKLYTKVSLVFLFSGRLRGRLNERTKDPEICFALGYYVQVRRRGTAHPASASETMEAGWYSCNIPWLRVSTNQAAGCSFTVQPLRDHHTPVIYPTIPNVQQLRLKQNLQSEIALGTTLMAKVTKRRILCFPPLLPFLHTHIFLTVSKPSLCFTQEYPQPIRDGTLWVS